MFPPSEPGPLNIAYVVPMSDGLHGFVYREIRELIAMGVKIHLFPTKIGHGPYEPPASWPVHRARPLAVVGAHARSLIRHPRRYAQVLTEAIVAGALLDFALGGLVADFLERHDIHLVHCHFGDHKLFIGHFAGRLSSRPVTVTIHAYELYNNPNAAMFRRALRNVAAVVTISAHNCRTLEQEYGVPADKIQLIPMFADIPELPVTPVRSGDRTIVLIVARLVEKKGHRALVEALAKLPANYEVWVVGTGPVDVCALADAAGVRDRVKVLGRLSDNELQEAYRQATIFALPSETTREGDREGIPVSLMEAMAHRLPVVATRHAGIPELVEELLVDEADVEGLAASLLKLGQDSDLRMRQGMRNVEIVAARFSRKNVLLLMDLFDRLRTKHKRPVARSAEAIVSE